MPEMHKRVCVDLNPAAVFYKIFYNIFYFSMSRKIISKMDFFGVAFLL
jgi:hypothetical protein